MPYAEWKWKGICSMRVGSAMNYGVTIIHCSVILSCNQCMLLATPNCQTLMYLRINSSIFMFVWYSRISVELYINLFLVRLWLNFTCWPVWCFWSIDLITRSHTGWTTLVHSWHQVNLDVAPTMLCIHYTGQLWFYSTHACLTQGRHSLTSSPNTPN